MGVDVDSAVAEYLELAALDFAPAQHWLGYCYLEGVGLDQDPRAALRWLEMAAARGFANAFHCLAWCYEHGHGVDEDQERAASLYGEAVELKFAQSCSNLGWMYIEGRGVKRYNWGGFDLFNEGKALGVARPEGLDEVGCGDVYVRREGLSRCLCSLGRCFQNGYAPMINLGHAKDHYERASLTGAAGGQWWLGQFYEFGAEGSPDLHRALGHYRQAMARGNASAARKVAALSAELGVEVEAPKTPQKRAPEALESLPMEELRELLYGPRTRVCLEEVHRLLTTCHRQLEADEYVVVEAYALGLLKEWPDHLKLCPDKRRSSPNLGAELIWVRDAGPTLERADELIEAGRYDEATALLRPGLGRADIRKAIHRLPVWGHPTLGTRDGTRYLPVAGLRSAPNLVWTRPEDVPRQSYDRPSGLVASPLGVVALRNESNLTVLDPDTGAVTAVTPTSGDFSFPPFSVHGELLFIDVLPSVNVIDLGTDRDLYTVDFRVDEGRARLYPAAEQRTNLWWQSNAETRTMKLPFRPEGIGSYALCEGLVVAWGPLMGTDMWGGNSVGLKLTPNHMVFSSSSEFMNGSRCTAYRRSDLSVAWEREGVTVAVDELGAMTNHCRNQTCVVGWDGEVWWTQEAQESRGLAMTPERVVCRRGGGLLLLERATGEEVGRLVDWSGGVEVACARDAVFVGSGQKVSAFCSESGARLWEQELDAVAPHLSEGVERRLTITSLALGSGRLFVRSADGTVYAFAH